MSSDVKNYEVYARVENFSSNTKVLEFKDFTITQIPQGSEAAKWRQFLNSRSVPKYILNYRFPRFVPNESDVSGFDGVMYNIKETLLCLRIYKTGDIAFNDMIIEDKDTREKSLGFYKDYNRSRFKYIFEDKDLKPFEAFRSDTIERSGFRNEYFRYAADFFMSGVDRGFNYKMFELRKIVDYVIALESLFLVGGNTPFLRSTLAKRISAFLVDTDCLKTMKAIYDERSNIVHGNNLGLDPNNQKKILDRIRKHMPLFESIIRRVFRKLLELDFKTKNELKEFNESLYAVPKEVVEIMKEAEKRAQKLIQT